MTREHARVGADVEHHITQPDSPAARAIDVAALFADHLGQRQQIPFGNPELAVGSIHKDQVPVRLEHATVRLDALLFGIFLAWDCFQPGIAYRATGVTLAAERWEARDAEVQHNRIYVHIH